MLNESNRFQNKDELSFEPRKPLSIIDFASNLDDLANTSLEDKIRSMNNTNEFQVDYLERTSKSILKTIGYYLNTTNPLLWVFIVFFSLVLTLILFILDLLIGLGLDFRLSLCNNGSSFINLLIWVSSAVVFLLISTSMGYFITSDADGSGIPEVKTVISGISIFRYFSVEAFFAKIIGLYAAIMGGASIGKVGPYVHLSAIVCSRLMKIKFFSKINSSTSTKNAMLSAAAAAGITLALGTPMGGVFFSMEVTSSIYLVGNIPKAFACTCICVLFSKLLHATNRNMNLFVAPEKLSPISDTVLILDVMFFILLGVICGIIGALLATLVSKLVYIRRKSKLKILNNRFYYAITISIIISIITFTVKPLMIFDRYMLGNLFNQNFPSDLDDLNHPSEGILLLVLFCFKFLITILTLGMNIPAGIFAPFFVIGAYFGRFYGHFFKIIFNLSEESIYAMVGAACVMSGATHSVSSAIIIFELTGQVSYLLPMLLSCLIANLTAQAFSISFFDVFLLMKNLPHLPSIKSNSLYQLTTEKIMMKELYPIKIDNFNYINSLEILLKIPRRYSRCIPIPIIDDFGIVRYTVQAKKLFKYVYRLFENYKLNYEAETQFQINSVIKHLDVKIRKKHRSFGQYLKYKIKKIFRSDKDKSCDRLNNIVEDERIAQTLSVLKECK
jgi:H+/Cl- antiporter ClcA